MNLFGKDTNTDLIVVAEIGVNHEGSVERATKMIDGAFNAGADAVKIQVGTVKGGAERKGGGFALGENQIRSLAKRCGMLNIPLFASALDVEAVKLCAELFPVIKIASRNFEDIPLLMAIKGTGLPVIASVGNADYNAAMVVTSLLKDVALLHCVPEYPAANPRLERLGLLLEGFPSRPIGYSNHCMGLNASYKAVVMGASIIELHFTDDKTQEFRDHHLSVEADELKEFMEGANIIRSCLNGGGLSI